MKGSYILETHLGMGKTIAIGKRGPVDFPAGCYVYVGSAMNSLENRIARHIRTEKKKRWHIDYFLEHADLYAVRGIECDDRLECRIASLMGDCARGIDRFGAGDCTRRTHLFYFPTQPALEKAVSVVLETLRSRYTFTVHTTTVNGNA